MIKITKEELDAMSYGEICEIILSDNQGKMKIAEVFRRICELLELSEADFENRIADFFELVSTDKKFIVLEGGFCDLRKKHTPEVIIEEEEEEETTEAELNEEDEIPEETDENEDIYYDNSSDEDDVDDGENELTDFIVLDEDETSM